MSDQSAEKQHAATSKRLEDLRKQGQTLRSRDLTGGISFITTMLLLYFISHRLFLEIDNTFEYLFNEIRYVPIHGLDLEHIATISLKVAIDMVPVYLCVLVLTLLSPFIFGGWNFSTQSLEFKFERINPIKNLSNIFSTRMIKNVFKSLLKTTIIMGTLITFIFTNYATIIKLTKMPLQSSLNQFTSITTTYIFILSLIVILFVIIDILFNYIEYQGKVKMTTQELKDEHKETDGNMDVKRKLRSMQISILKQRVHILVPKATVIITNPTHYAVALQYREGLNKAPTLLIKGKDLIALQIRKIASLNQIPIYESPMLARAIYKTTKQNQEIHPGLYTAVAIVLTYINQLKLYQNGYARQPEIIYDLKIPNEFMFNE